ncbi:MAG: hypothetical protein CM15mP4_3970 [Candidatus Neomarinimicrobiota bacterium]|nr:MAG: hypothetical protein CM15mP4_3970 [Candidatus Neomarinimicrobiota bacterium]
MGYEFKITDPEGKSIKKSNPGWQYLGKGPTVINKYYKEKDFVWIAKDGLILEILAI